MSKIEAAAAKPNESGVLAQEITRSFGELVDQFEKYYSLPREEAIQRASAPFGTGQRVDSIPPDQVSWLHLREIARDDPGKSLARWEEVKRAALHEIQTGHRAAKAMEVYSETVWERAQFLALREELSAEWRPRNGIERQLLDTMAQAQTNYLVWVQNLSIRTSLVSSTNKKKSRVDGGSEAPRQSDADAVDQSMSMMERHNGIFLRCLRSLCDMRRQTNSVVVKQGGQVNLAQQQVNMNSTAK